MKSVASIILSGGEGTRLHPLTLNRCKPAIEFGGKRRLIDVPLTLSLQAGCRKIFLLTQFLASSLHRHVYETYMTRGFGTGIIEILTAEQKPSRKAWFQGTADAVRQNLEYLLECPVDYFLILSGDQLYNLDFKKMVSFAQQTDADAVIAALPVTLEATERMGIMAVNKEFFITDFHEKPRDKEQLEKLKLSPQMIKQIKLSAGKNKCYLGSMGIYLFKRKALIDLLNNDLREDFGKHLIPSLIKKGKTVAFLHDGYWEDIGTIRSFYEANMALTKPIPKFNLYEEGSSIFNLRSDLPSAKIHRSYLDQSIISEGSRIDGAKIRRSILGPRSVVKKGTVIEDSYLMGNDYYISESPEEAHHFPDLSIGENCHLKQVIIDKNVHIGNNVHLVNAKRQMNYNGGFIFVVDGVIVVPKGVSIPDGFVL